MEIFAISCLVFFIFSLAMAIGLLLGKGPLHVGCTPGGSTGGCPHKGNCALPCAKRRGQSRPGEKSPC